MYTYIDKHDFIKSGCYSSYSSLNLNIARSAVVKIRYLPALFMYHTDEWTV